MNTYVWAAIIIAVMALPIVGFLWWEAEMMDRNRKDILKAAKPDEFWLSSIDDGPRRANRDHHAD